MKKIGIIGEGSSETIIFNSEAFNNFSLANQLSIVGVYNAGGRDIILNKSPKIESFFKIFKDLNADYIIIVSDLENDVCISAYKNKIPKYDDKQIEIVAVRSIESWLLADTDTLKMLLDTEFYYEYPESTNKLPFDELQEIFLIHTQRGLGPSKPRIMKRFVRSGFSVSNSANHKNCPSAAYFVNKLKEISKV